VHGTFGSVRVVGSSLRALPVYSTTGVSVRFV
jgi:hypothetical protein